MKLNEIKKACVARGSAYIFNRPDGRQWIFNGAGAWPVEGITVTQGNIPALFDLTPKKLDEMYIQETEWKDPRFEVEPQENDAPLQDVGNVLFCGEVLKALKGDGGLLFISMELLKPVSGKKEELVFFARSMEGKAPLVAVFGDMLCGGLIVPIDGTLVMEKLEKITREPLWDWAGTGEQTRI